MQSKQKTELVEVTYWTCCVSAHRHQAKHVAEACIAKHEKPPFQRRRWTDAMMADAVEAVLGGATYREAGEKFGVSPARAANIVRQALRIMSHDSRRTGTFPMHDYTAVAEVRKHADYWTKETKKFREAE